MLNQYWHISEESDSLPPSMLAIFCVEAPTLSWAGVTLQFTDISSTSQCLSKNSQCEKALYTVYSIWQEKEMYFEYIPWQKTCLQRVSLLLYFVSYNVFKLFFNIRMSINKFFINKFVNFVCLDTGYSSMDINSDWFSRQTTSHTLYNTTQKKTLHFIYPALFKFCQFIIFCTTNF